MATKRKKLEIPEGFAGVMNELKKNERRSYQRKYQAKYKKKQQALITGPIRGTKQEVEILLRAKERAGISWVRVLFRGLGVKRPGDA